ncbi:phytanoyl-CoA dioxygenase family protein [Cellvibrio sp. PSBB023]|uniref:phytanoyl-CoA dioxygenase family protein n=1 Tax=Cellvibrio sp. PSBB023 TaxID=1945512 RepID=UPI00098FB147|nr:phytanoyl-CoA dioxygenase family protein [Cellvibrio sp. PSBB023]AQT58671.1 hypothetical protein B0D95_00115 [Cellvibrio sp. PSBB023]
MSLDNCGFALINDFLSAMHIEKIHMEIDRHIELGAAGIRCAEQKNPAIRELVSAENTLALARHYLQAEPLLIRCILFDKTADNNWLVTWHQDKTLCISEKFEHADWHPWSIKDGVHHVQPPIAILKHMLTLRIHLDDTTTENGCLRVIPETHKQGILSSEQILRISKSEQSIDCCAAAGSVLVMKPLLLHASRKAPTPSRRRVIHIEYIDRTALNF